jgi:hypothetical protein
MNELEFRDLIGQLAPKICILNPDEPTCVWCNNWTYDTGPGPPRNLHKPDCPWVKARRLLGDNLPE